jgi:DNA repair protein RadC
MSEKKSSSGRQWIKNWPESERPREKLSLFGPEALSDGELLAVLLRIGKAGQSAEDLGRLSLSPLSRQKYGLYKVHHQAACFVCCSKGFVKYIS